MTTHFLDWKKPVIPGLEPIRAERREIRIPIEACGFDRSGHFFTERTETLDVSESGCKFRLRAELACDAILAVRVLNDDRGARASRPVLFRAVRAEQKAGAWSVGAAKLQQDDPWTDGLFEVPARDVLAPRDANRNRGLKRNSR